VLRVPASSAPQCDLSITGKSPAITAVAKAELPQSYRAHAHTGRRVAGRSATGIGSPLRGIRASGRGGGAGPLLR